MKYYIHMLVAMADARYQAAYWEQVAVSEWWLSLLSKSLNGISHERRHSLRSLNDAGFLSPHRAFVVFYHWPAVGRAMKALILAACAVSVPCLADDGIPWMTPHVVDTGVSMAVLQSVPGAVELHPLGFPGVVVAKFAMEGIALGYRDAGDVETCQAVAGGARWGGWIGTGATLGGLAAGPVGLAIGGLGAGLFSWQWSQESAQWTCSQPPPVDSAPYSYSGVECMGWNNARPDFCNEMPK